MHISPILRRGHVCILHRPRFLHCVGAIADMGHSLTRCTLDDYIETVYSSMYNNTIVRGSPLQYVYTRILLFCGIRVHQIRPDTFDGFFADFTNFSVGFCCQVLNACRIFC